MNPDIRARRSWRGDATKKVSTVWLVMLLVFIVVAPLSGCGAADQPDEAIALGARTGSIGFGNPPWNNAPIDAYVQEAGREPDFVLWFQSWGPRLEATFPRAGAEEIHQRGYTQVITWVPEDYSLPPDDPSYSLDATLSGVHDDYVRQYARDLVAWGRPVYLRPFHEMNDTSNAYAAGKNGNTPEKLVAAWRRVHQIFAQEGATNVKWVWSPSVGPPTYHPQYPMASYYPGDDYVDWMALDGYNWAEARSLPWYSFDEIYSQSYAEITAISPKPVMIAEIGSHTWPGDKALWIDEMREDVPAKYPRVKAVSWYHQNADGGLWRINTSRATLHAYQMMAADKRWQGHLP